jgi:hypothetical protein
MGTAVGASWFDLIQRALHGALCVNYIRNTLLAVSLIYAQGADAAPSVAALGAAVEQGDDLMRPAAGLHLGINDKYFARAWIWGREFGPVVEQSVLISAGRTVPAFGSKIIVARFGVAALAESTSVQFTGTDEHLSRETTQYNLGAVAGLHLHWNRTAPLLVTAGWESHLFLAGVAGILLSTGRKQTLSVGLGWEFK